MQYFTAESLEKIKKELNHLKTVETKKIADLLKYTASFGDLSENAAYDDAKERQMFLQMRIKELEVILAGARIVEKEDENIVQVGSVVAVFLGGKKEKFEITAPSQADVLKNKISYESPLGKAMFGKKAGEKFSYKIEDKEVRGEILAIE